jgi:hypothetical protein
MHCLTGFIARQTQPAMRTANHSDLTTALTCRAVDEVQSGGEDDRLVDSACAGVAGLASGSGMSASPVGKVTVGRVAARLRDDLPAKDAQQFGHGEGNTPDHWRACADGVAGGDEIDVSEEVVLLDPPAGLRDCDQAS